MSLRSLQFPIFVTPALCEHQKHSWFLGSLAATFCTGQISSFQPSHSAHNLEITPREATADHLNTFKRFPLLWSGRPSCPPCFKDSYTLPLKICFFVIYLAFLVVLKKNIDPLQTVSSYLDVDNSLLVFRSFT